MRIEKQGVTMKKVCVFFVLVIALILTSCGGGGGGAGGTAAGGTGSTSSSSSGGSAVSIQFNGLYARANGSVWDTIDYLDLKIIVDGAEAFSKHLTASDNVVLVEHLTPGSTAYATGSLKYNEMNGGDTASIRSDTITLEQGSNTLTLNVVYTYKLIGDQNNTLMAGTYTAASGISVPDNIIIAGEYILTGWYYDDDRTQLADMNGIRGNVVLYAKYEQNSDYFRLEIPEDWNGYLYLGTIDDDEFNGSNYHAAGWLPVYGVDHASELHYEKISGDAELHVEFSDEDEGVFLYIKAVNMGSARYRVSKGSYYVDFNVNVDAMTYLEGDIDHGNVILSHFLVPAGAPATATFTYYVGNANWHFTLSPNAAQGEVQQRIRYVVMENAHIDSIPDRLFYGCTNLTQVDFPNGTEANEWNGGQPVTEFTSIGEQAFANSGIQSVDLTKCTHLTSIGENAFANCYSLNTLSLPASLTSIGQDAFLACSGLANMTVRFEGNLNEWRNIGSGGAGWGGLENITNLVVNVNQGANRYDVLYNGVNWVY